MSVTVAFSCENYENLLSTNLSLGWEDVSTSSDSLRQLLFPYDDLDFYRAGKQNFFTELEQFCGLKNVVFGPASMPDDNDQAFVEASQAVWYFQSLLTLPSDMRQKLPGLYSVKEFSTGYSYLNVKTENWKIQGGYNHCIAWNDLAIEDMRTQNVRTFDNRLFCIERNDVLALFYKQFAAMSRIAYTAQNLQRRCVFTIY